MQEGLTYIKTYIEKNKKILYNTSHKGGYFDMNEEQKRFKILKKESYEQQISEKKKKTTTSVFAIGFFSSLEIYFLSYALQDSFLLGKVFFAILGLYEAGCSANYIRILIESICEKTMLQGKVEDIVNELEMLEIEEKGRRK